MKLNGRLVPVAEVTAQERDAMFNLMDRHYENVHRGRFEADLAEKQWVIELREPATRELRGFSTQVLLEATVEGHPIKALFSGDTIVDRDHWGDSALAHVWGNLALRLMDECGDMDLFWFLISKGYKTYRFLPLFFHEFYPHPDVNFPPGLRKVRDALGRLKFPAEYDPAVGVVRAGPNKDRLRAGIADVNEGRLQNSWVRFFVEQNPGHLQGEELCCLAPLTRANFTAAAYRVIGAQRARESA